MKLIKSLKKICFFLIQISFILFVQFKTIYSNSVQLTFELPDNEKQCFYEHINKGINTVVEFQV